MTAHPPALTLQLLGPFRLACEGVGVNLAYDKGRALLAFLALHAGRSYTRAYLAELLWPDLERTTALANLRLVLHNLRPKINRTGETNFPLLQVSRDAVALQVDARIQVDTARFLAPTPVCTTVAAPGFCETCLAKMAQCAALYQGALLQDFVLPDCPEFEDWLPARRAAARRCRHRQVPPGTGTSAGHSHPWHRHN